jgi:hypothetical protein
MVYVTDVLTNTMNVLGDATMGGTREVKIDDVHNVLDVQSTSRDASGHHDRASSTTEGTPVERISTSFRCFGGKSTYRASSRSR